LESGLVEDAFVILAGCDCACYSLSLSNLLREEERGRFLESLVGTFSVSLGVSFEISLVCTSLTDSLMNSFVTSFDTSFTFFISFSSFVARFSFGGAIAATVSDF
jgi:hypothetical protein